MAETQRVEKKTDATKTSQDEDTHLVSSKEVKAASQRGEELKKELDDLLDEIDGVLEENAEEFVRNYRQKGGE